MLLGAIRSPNPIPQRFTRQNNYTYTYTKHTQILYFHDCKQLQWWHYINVIPLNKINKTNSIPLKHNQMRNNEIVYMEWRRWMRTDNTGEELLNANEKVEELEVDGNLKVDELVHFQDGGDGFGDWNDFANYELGGLELEEFEGEYELTRRLTKEIQRRKKEEEDEEEDDEEDMDLHEIMKYSKTKWKYEGLQKRKSSLLRKADKTKNDDFNDYDDNNKYSNGNVEGDTSFHSLKGELGEFAFDKQRFEKRKRKIQLKRYEYMTAETEEKAAKLMLRNYPSLQEDTTALSRNLYLRECLLAADENKAKMILQAYPNDTLGYEIWISYHLTPNSPKSSIYPIEEILKDIISNNELPHPPSFLQLLLHVFQTSVPVNYIIRWIAECLFDHNYVPSNTTLHDILRMLVDLEYHSEAVQLIEVVLSISGQSIFDSTIQQLFAASHPSFTHSIFIYNSFNQTASSLLLTPLLQQFQRSADHAKTCDLLLQSFERGVFFNTKAAYNFISTSLEASLNHLFLQRISDRAITDRMFTNALTSYVGEVFCSVPFRYDQARELAVRLRKQLPYFLNPNDLKTCIYYHYRIKDMTVLRKLLKLLMKVSPPRNELPAFHQQSYILSLMVRNYLRALYHSPVVDPSLVELHLYMGEKSTHLW